MRKKFTMLFVALFVCMGVMKAEVVKFDANSESVLPGTLTDEQYNWKSSVMNSPDGFTTLRLTFLENTGDGVDRGGFPHVALAEFYLYDKDGKPVQLTDDRLSSNATETNEGKSGIGKLCDGFTVKQENEDQYDWYWHSFWSANAGAYHYLEINVAELEADLSTFAVGYVTRQSNGSPAEMLVTTGSSTEDVAAQYGSYMILGKYDLSTQAFRIKNSNITSEDLYLTIETPNCNDQNEDGVKILEKAIGNESQAFKFIPQTDGSFYIKSESGYFLNTHERWGFNAVGEAVTTEKRSNFNLEYLNNGEFRIKGAKGYIGPNDAYPTDHAYELFSNHGADKRYIDWVVEPYTQEYLLTYNYKVGGVTMFTEEHVVNADAAYPAVKSFYGVNIVGTVPEGTVSANGTYDFTCTVDDSKFPFDYAADVASIDTWQYIQMHSNNKKYLKYESNYIAWADADLGLGKKDAYAWAFVGNPFTGFKMLNKAATEEKALKSTGSGNPAMANYADGTSFLAAASNQTGNAGYFCMQYPSGNYLNAQDGKLNHWGANDAGSTMLVKGTWHEITLEEYTADLSTLVGLAETLVSNNQANADKVGYYKLSDVQAQIDNAKQYTESKNIDEVDAAFLALQGVMNSPEVNLPVAGKFYRIMNNGGTGYLSTGTGTGRTQFVEGIGELASSIFYYTGTKLVDYTTGLYLANNNNFLHYTETVGEAAGTTISFAKSPALGKLLITFNGNRGFYSAGTGESNAAGSGSSGDSYRFTITEVEWLPVAINEEVGYATFYSPVELYLSNGRVKAYTGKVDGNVLKLTEQEVVPANTGVILELQEDAEVENGYTFLQVKETTVTDLDNDLTGTFAKTYVEEEAYVLSNKNGIGLYKATKNQEGNTSWLNNAFKAYLPATAVPNGAQAISFGRGEGTTGIDKAQLTMDNVVIYDLLGRRVEKMEKGIYIVNGKKIIK